MGEDAVGVDTKGVNTVGVGVASCGVVGDGCSETAGDKLEAGGGVGVASCAGVQVRDGVGGGSVVAGVVVGAGLEVVGDDDRVVDLSSPTTVFSGIGLGGVSPLVGCSLAVLG